MGVLTLTQALHASFSLYTLHMSVLLLYFISSPHHKQIFKVNFLLTLTFICIYYIESWLLLRDIDITPVKVQVKPILHFVKLKILSEDSVLLICRDMKWGFTDCTAHVDHLWLHLYAKESTTSDGIRSDLSRVLEWIVLQDGD